MELSNELLSSVLGRKVQTLDPNTLVDENHICKPTLMQVVLEDKIDQHGVTAWYNVHELAHKFKEWALKEGYELHSYTHKNYFFDVVSHCSVKSVHTGKIVKETNERTEPETIFKACQWILNGR